MNKIVAFILILILAPVLGGLYGIIHDQITYAISPEYYTKFKFIQFRLESMGLGENIGTLKSPEIIMPNPRNGVGIVGAMATWWVGLIIGIILSIVGLIHRNGSEMFKATAKAILLTIFIALITGLVGLLVGKFLLSDATSNWYIPDNVIDRASFIAVGSMHNFSYLGGLLGLIAGIILSIRQKQKYKVFHFDK